MADGQQQMDLLYELQEVDAGIDAAQAYVRGADPGKEAGAKLAAARQKLAVFQKKKHALEGRLKDRELKLQSTEQDRKEREKQAYGGKISDPKQLRALQQKIEELGRLEDKLEEETLELIETNEKATRAIAKQQKLVDDLAREAASDEAGFAEEKARLLSELEGLIVRRAALVAAVGPSPMKHYENLRSKLGGVAVAAVKQGSCTGCKTGIPSTYAPKLRDRVAIVQCENCRRILYLAQGESPFRPEEDV